MAPTPARFLHLKLELSGGSLTWNMNNWPMATGDGWNCTYFESTDNWKRWEGFLVLKLDLVWWVFFLCNRGSLALLVMNYVLRFPHTKSPRWLSKGCKQINIETIRSQKQLNLHTKKTKGSSSWRIWITHPTLVSLPQLSFSPYDRWEFCLKPWQSSNTSVLLRWGFYLPNSFCVFFCLRLIYKPSSLQLPILFIASTKVITSFISYTSAHICWASWLN